LRVSLESAKQYTKAKPGADPSRAAKDGIFPQRTDDKEGRDQTDKLEYTEGNLERTRIRCEASNQTSPDFLV